MTYAQLTSEILLLLNDYVVFEKELNIKPVSSDGIVKIFGARVDKYDNSIWLLYARGKWDKVEDNELMKTVLPEVLERLKNESKVKV